MSSKSITPDKAKKNAIIKVFNDEEQRYTNVVVPSKVTIGLGGDDFSEGLATHGPIEFKSTTAPSTTSLKLYVVGTSLHFNGSEVGSGGGGAGGGSPWENAAGLTYSTGSVAVGTVVGSPGERTTLWVGGGYLSSFASEGIYVAAGSNDDAKIALFEEVNGTSTGFGTTNSFGFCITYDGGDNKLYFKTGVNTTVTNVGTWDRTSGIFQAKKEYHHHFQGYRGGSAKMYPDWYGSADVTDLNTTGQYSQAMLMAPYNGYFKSAKIRCLNATSGTPGATVIAAHKGGSITNIDPQAVTISALNTEYEVEFSEVTTAFTKGELLSLSVNPNSSISYFLIDLTLVYDEQT